MNKTMDFEFDLKSLNDNGMFSGYGSVFGIKDSYGDIVAPGAFTASLANQKASGRLPAMLWQHRSSEPLGIYKTMAEDDIGLKVEGQLAIDTSRGAEAYSLLKIGAISGLSIGYQVREESYDKVTGINTLKQVDLWEVSLVTFPANDSARVQGVKNIELIENIRDAERYLRESGLSRTEAVAFIGRVKSLGQRDADEGEVRRLLVSAINRRNKTLAK